MGNSLRFVFSSCLRKYAVFALACFWSLGLILGILVAKDVSFEFSLFSTGVQQNSIPGALLVTMFPIVASVSLLYMGQTWLIPAVAFLKSFNFAYVSWILMRDFGSACWLIQLLIMFCDCVSIPLLWWFWCRFLKSSNTSLFPLSFVMVLAFFAIAILDSYLISPILLSLQIS